MHDQLKTTVCPGCGTVGSVTVGEVLVARPLGTWSLAGMQPKVTTVSTPALVCGAGSCQFRKLSSGFGVA